MCLKEHAPQLYPLPSSSIVVVMCDKISGTYQAGMHGHDTIVKDCALFLDNHVTMAMSKFPTRPFALKCTRPIEHQRVRVNPLTIWMARQSYECILLHEPRARRIMTARDILHNEFRKYMKAQAVGILGGDASSLVVIVKRLTDVVFPLTLSVWKQLNDTKNRRCAAPDLEFGVFFGRKVKGHKADRPCCFNTCRSFGLKSGKF